MSVYLKEVLVVATTASGTIEMSVEASISDIFFGALDLGAATAGTTRIGTLTDPQREVAVSTITPADITLQIAYDVQGAVWFPFSLYVIGRDSAGVDHLLAAIPQWPSGVGMTELGDDGRTSVSSGHNYYIVTAQSVMNAA